MTKVLLIDNFDSFTYNLVDEFAKLGCKVEVYRNDLQMDGLQRVMASLEPNLIVISPGPGTPKSAGNSMPIIKKYSGKIPIFGVCLGLQCMAEVFGGRVGRAGEIVHGKSSMITHDEKGIYKGIENPFQGGRYHSLAALKVPSSLKVTAKSENGLVMGLEHRRHKTIGVQFHPESILTSEGGKMIENLLKAVGK